MSEIVRAALVQAEWTGDRDSMVDKNIGYAHDAANQGAQVICFQEIFNAPYFCNKQENQYFDTAEAIPDGPTVQAMIKVAKETGMVVLVPIFEKVDEGTFYNTTAFINPDGEFLGVYRKTHIPQVEGFWEKFYFRPGNTGYPVFDTAVGRIAAYICYDRHFPEGWRALGLNGARIVFNPSATTRGHSKHLWQVEQPAAAVANEYFIGAINRVGSEDLEGTDYYGTSYFANPRGEIIGDAASDTKDEVVVRDLDMDMIEQVRRHWAFYRDRRPETYDSISAR
ncbi:MAG: acyltransferase [Actinobacteria bacterium]|nr:acyltransferase [Actinomycetota bacterium]